MKLDPHFLQCNATSHVTKFQGPRQAYKQTFSYKKISGLVANLQVGPLLTFLINFEFLKVFGVVCLKQNSLLKKVSC